MNKADMHQFKVRQRLIYLNSFIYMSFVYLFALIYFFIESIVIGNDVFAIVVAVLFITALAWMVPVLIWFNRHGYGKDPMQPYSVKTDCYSVETLLARIQRKIALDSLCEDTFCCVELGKRRIHWMVFLTEEYSSEAVTASLKKIWMIALQKGVFPKRMSMTEYNKTVRCNIITVNRMNEEAISASKKNAVGDMHAGEKRINVILDLETGTLYIPALWGGILANCRTYGIVINRLISIFT